MSAGQLLLDDKNPDSPPEVHKECPPRSFPQRNEPDRMSFDAETEC